LAATHNLVSLYGGFFHFLPHRDGGTEAEAGADREAGARIGGGSASARGQEHGRRVCGSEGEIFYIVRAELRAYPPPEAAELRRRPGEISYIIPEIFYIVRAEGKENSLII